MPANAQRGPVTSTGTQRGPQGNKGGSRQVQCASLSLLAPNPGSVLLVRNPLLFLNQEPESLSGSALPGGAVRITRSRSGLGGFFRPPKTDRTISIAMVGKGGRHRGDPNIRAARGLRCSWLWAPTSQAEELQASVGGEAPMHFCSLVHLCHFLSKNDAHLDDYETTLEGAQHSTVDAPGLLPGSSDVGGYSTVGVALAPPPPHPGAD